MTNTNRVEEATGKTGFKSLAMVVLVVLVMFCLLGLSFRVVLLPQVTTLLADNTVNDELAAVGHEELVDTAERGRDFVDCVPGATMPEGANERTAFTPEVVSHMEDVRSVIRIAAFVTFALCIFVALLSILTWRFFGRKSLGSALLIGGISTFTLATVLSIVGLISFDALFTAMHELLFADGTWTFSADSLLISAYPIEFWIGMAVVWAISLVLLCALCIGLGLLLRRRGRKERDARI